MEERANTGYGTVIAISNSQIPGALIGRMTAASNKTIGNDWELGRGNYDD